MTMHKHPHPGTRPAAVAGMFYPAEEQRLQDQIRTYLHQVLSWPGRRPKALIVPHAGYIYSGPVAAAGYECLRNQRYSRIVLLGPAHTLAVRGIVFPEAEVFQTPLGSIHLDHAAMLAVVQKQAWTQRLDAAHMEEHCLEVQLPFLQTLLPPFQLIPAVVGHAEPVQVQQTLEYLWGDSGTLIVISTDLSHYHSYRTACRLDAGTADAIEACTPERLDPESACGRHALAGLLLAARRRKMTVVRRDLRNSGDTAGDHDRVVGYGAWVLTETENRD